ncbi:hypothetical protein NHB29_22520 (plasmid) [Pantoea agglomerans]|uniref:hypothetical protein n=1 Tax=Enterobacter agglomerans TaxID=549 RepID=UPI00273A6EA1|nr:hypothetical protein [Pantoea agglomerans]WLO87195.1 hypothetical protein NHB29_22520 [Pantoea agglomerans]
MKKILLLVKSADKFQPGNHLRIYNSLIELGYKPDFAIIDTASIKAGKVSFDVVEGLPNKIDIEIKYTIFKKSKYIEEYDILWQLSQPHPSIRREVDQILWVASRSIKFVNSLEGTVYLNNKIGIQEIIPEENLLLHHISCDARYLLDIVNHDGSEWVIKPPNGGNGIEVFFVSAEDTNTKVIIESLCGNEAGLIEMYGEERLGIVRRHAVLQPRVSNEIIQKRVVLVNGKVFPDGVEYAATLTELTKINHRTNTIHGGLKKLCGLTEEEKNLCNQVAENLLGYGIRYAAIDLAYPYIFEINTVNPGGILIIEKLSNVKFFEEAVKSILESIQ